MAWYNNIFGNNKPKKRQTFKRSYQGADTGRLFADFLTSSASADAEIKDNIRVLRDRARELARNDSYIARYLNLMVSNVIGKHGVRISSKARNDDQSLDIGANILIERAWKTLQTLSMHLLHSKSSSWITASSKPRRFFAL